ncbi:DUF4214 domain-containing protein [Pseudomonas sp. FSL R10-2964]|uniref:DUF4214 domain-containing protein n=1 Tax=Pseudomonas sp. FSL R10-2964 TaxID=2662202 RepID=UPI001297C464|nr:DUF4214 domain-containing protein [Pseudomonas sp. FSL R10-2964]MQT84001.1 DUF4214 domain-containing protein [Pseudomonas sp. FSL R10-2964]
MSETARLTISVDSSQARGANKDLGALERGASTLTSGLSKMIAPLVSVATAMAALNKASDVQRQFDVLNAGLITATGSSEKAASAFKALQEFAQKTPYDLNQAVKGFTQLVNLGLTPSEKALMSYGNTASAMGKDLNQMIEAVADAATGEFERLKEFGIKAKANGDQVSLIFQGVTTKVGNNAKEIESFLINLGETKFGDAMSLRMATLDGAISNLGDTWENTFRLVNDAGLGDVMRESVNDAAEALGELNNMLASGEMEGYLEASSIAWSGWASDITESVRLISDFLDDAWIEWGDGAKDASKGMYLGFKEFPAEIRAYFQEAAVEAISFVDRLVAQGVYAKDAIAAIFDNTTLDDARKKYDATVSVSNQVRQDMIDDISQEKDATINAVNEKIESSKGLRHEYDLQQKAAKALTADRLAQYKTKGDGSSASSSSAVDKAAKAAAALAAQQEKALTSFLATSAISTTSMTAMSDAYLAGADNVRELSIQQKIEQETLKLGADAHDAVAAAVRKEADAKDRLDITQSIASMRTETTQTLAQATATLQGKDALEAFNIQKSMTVALAGRNIEVGSKEYQLLLDQTKAQLDANKALEQASKVEGIVDRLSPQIKLLKDYTAERDALNAAMIRDSGNVALYQDALAKLGNEYEVNRSKATLWGQMTEAAVDRIDDAFADMWKSVLSKSGDFMDTLKNSFRQFLAEMLHMAITKPIIVQIASSLGVGGASSGGLSSILGGGSGGGMNAQGMFETASKAYSVATSAFGDAVSAGWTAGEGFLGGVQGAFKAGSGYLSSSIGSLFGSAAGSSGAMVNGVYQLGSSGGVATVDLISNTVTNSSGAVTGSASAATTTAASAGLSATSAVMYGIGGAIQGYLKAGVKGAVAGAGGAVAGAYAGAAIGSAVPIIGTAIGAAIGAVLGGMFGSSLFGGDWVTKDQGFQLGVNNGELNSYNFEYQKKKGGLFSSNKKRTRLSALDPDMQAALDNTYASTLGTVIGLFDSLNVELSDGVLDGLSVSATKISTKGKTAEAIQAELAKWFGGLADAAASEINKVTDTGFGKELNFEYLTTFVNNLYSVAGSLEMIGAKTVDFNIIGGRAVEHLVALAGGIENLNKNITTFYDGFTTDLQKSASTLDGVRAQFAAMQVVLPETRQGFADVVKGLDTATEAGRILFGSLTANSEQAAAMYTILEQRESAYRKAFFSEAENTALAIKNTTTELKALGVILPASRSEYRKMVEEAAKSTTDTGKAMYDTLMNAAGAASTVFDELERRLNQGVTDSFSLFQRSISAQQKAATAAYNATNTSLSDMSATAVKSVTDLSSVSNSLESALKSLRGTSDDAVKTLRAQAQATLQSALATARAGGSLASFTGLEDALDTVSNNNTDLYGSMEDFARDQGRTANVVAELNAINGKQLTAAEKLQKSIEDQIGVAKAAYDAQMAQFDQQLEFAQAQMDAFNGIDTSVKSVEAAIKALNGSLIASLAAKPATGAGSAMANTAANNATVVDTLYQQLFGRTADAGENKYWADRLGSGNLPYAEIVANMTQYASAADKAAMAAMGKVPAYASGGDHLGGLRLVGENGPELEVTGPSRIFNANQTASMLKGGSDMGALVSELKQMREENKSQRFQIAKTNQQVASMLQKWDAEGTPKERDYAL